MLAPGSYLEPQCGSTQSMEPTKADGVWGEVNKTRPDAQSAIGAEFLISLSLNFYLCANQSMRKTNKVKTGANSQNLSKKTAKERMIKEAKYKTTTSAQSQNPQPLTKITTKAGKMAISKA